MSLIQESLFDLLLNALVQIGLFAIVAAVFSRLVAKARAKHQYCFYVAVLLLCLAAPVANTFWHRSSTAVAQESPQHISPDAGAANRISWIWQQQTKSYERLIIPAGFQTWIIGAWAVSVLLRLTRFLRAVHRVHRLRRDASVLPRARVGTAHEIIAAEHRIALLESSDIDDPVTVGVIHPTILLPSKVLPELGERDISAILLHEYGHIRRRDFLAHVVCELISLPMAWHPGIAYLMSKISQTRELACDDYAAARLGKRRAYANSVLRLASLCLHVPRTSAVGLGIFDGDNLEVRIMMLTEKNRSLSRTSAIALVMTISILFGVGAVVAHAMSRQANSKESSTADKFAGTWHWMFDGRSFSTMILVRTGSGFTGSVTPSGITLDDKGELSNADPLPNSKPAPITKATLEGSALRVTVKDGDDSFEFTVTLKDATHAEIHPVGAPPKMKPIPAEKVQ